tara:strand:+ start:32 stop:574 length:543 start_codon:yes stop_codon:yes gene_type:complete
MADKSFEILPHALLEDLKFDVEALKKKLSEPDSKANELILEIESLKDSIHDMHTVFGKALEETKEEDIYAAIKKLNERIDTVVTQNETIARGMIAISDKVDDFISSNKKSAPAMTRPSMTSGQISPPSMHANMSPSPQGIPKAPQMSMPSSHNDSSGQFNMSSGGIPPPPSEMKKRRGFF